MKCSVITVNYNNCKALERTIISTINQQKFNDFEYIIIDGASTDGSVDIIKKFANKIDYWVSEPDKGIYDAMNKGVAVAKGDYCIFMNSGDCFYDDTVLNKIFSNPNCNADFIAGNYCINGVVKESPSKITAITLFKTIDKSICHQALFTKRDILTQSPYQTEYYIIADFVNQFHSIILNNATYQYINVTICDIEPGGISAVNYRELEKEKESYLQNVLPERIYDDYKNFISIKLIESRYNELYALLQRYNFSNTDLKVTTTVLKVIAFLKEMKIQITHMVNRTKRD